MGASVPPIRPDDTSTGGMLHRVLTPDEFHQARQLPPEALNPSPFPLLPPGPPKVPPAAPADATRQLNPNTPRDGGTKIPGLAGILTRQVVNPIMDHPLTSAAVGLGSAIVPPLNYVWLGMMGKDVVEYAAQKAAEMSLDPDTQRAIANDPEYQSQRISGEQAGVEAATLGLTGAGAAVARLKAGKPIIPSVAEVTQPIREQVADVIAPHLANERRSLAREVNTDALTGLGNQRAFRAALPAAEADPNTAVIRFDANGFKAVNDTHGHDVGDEVLARMGDAIRAQAKDLPAFRVGGDEFAVVAPKDQAPAVRDAIEQAVGVHQIDGPHFETGEPASTLHSISGGVGDTNAEADAAAKARKTEQKAAQGIPDRNGVVGTIASGEEGGQSIAAMAPPPKALPAVSESDRSGARTLGLLAARSGRPTNPFLETSPLHSEFESGYASVPKDDVGAYNDLRKPVDPTALADYAEAAQHALSDPNHIDYAKLPGGSPQTAKLNFAVQKHVANVTQALSDIAPADQARSILRANLGDAAANYEQAAFKVDEFRRAIDWLPENDKLGFVDAIEHGASQPSAEFQPLADMMRTTLDGTRDQIRALGTGKLEQYIQNYFPHSGIWQDPEHAEMTFKSLVGFRRPMEGTKSFLKERSIPTVMDGVKQGLELAEGWNPIDVFLSNYRDMQRYLFAHKSFAEAKEQGIMQLVRPGEQAPDGYARINDKIATVFGKPTVTVSEAFDAQQRAAIEHAIDQLGGVTVKRALSLEGKNGLPAGALGYAKGDSEIGAKFGSHDGVLMHELGHIVDNRFGMGAALAKTENGSAELAALADLRAESTPNVDAGYRAYLQKPEEQAANALHAYLHAPERMQDVAPHVYDALDKFLQSDPKLAAIRDIKPSLELGTAEREVPIGGTVIRGNYYAPAEVATVFNNHLSPGLPQVLRESWGPKWGEAAARAFDLYRGLGNSMNQAQLGFSAFHLGMTSLDAAVSRAALGLEEAGSGDFVNAAKHLNPVSVATAPLPGVVQGTIGDLLNHVLGTDVQMGLGAKLRQAYFTPEKASPEMQTLAQYLREAGGRIGEDSFYKNSAADRFMSAVRESAQKIGEGEAKDAFTASLRAGQVALPALLETAAKPIMEHVVPLQKLQVFGELAQKAVRDLPPDATLTDRRIALQKVWDSVDNRMGQLVYDNLFWHRTFKDLAMASTRSVGWNLGTIRELGGGYVDLAKAGANVAKGDLSAAEMTHRAYYAIALPLTVGLTGAAYQYLRTGEGPSELKDYFYPKTGEQDADGNDERVQLPSYMKDLAAYAGSPWQTVTHKIAPFPNLVYEMLQNQDFYGDEVRNPNDPAVKQVQQEAEFVAKSALPFSYRNSQEQKARGDQATATKFGNWFGVTPAPRRVVRSDAQNAMNDILATKGPAGATPEEAAHRDQVRALVDGLRGQTTLDPDQLEQALNSGQLVPADIGRAMKRAGMTPAQEKFRRLGLDDALKVFDKATDREKALFADALTKKLGRVATK